MNSQEYFAEVERGLYGLPQEDIARWLEYYKENLADRMEDGADEESALSQMGTPDALVQQILAQTPLTRVLRAKVKPKNRVPVWAVVLLALGSPLWLSLVIAAVAVFFSVYVVLWSLVISLYAVDMSFFGCTLGGVGGCLMLLLGGHFAPAMLLLAGGIVCLGLGVLCFLPLGKITKATVQLCGSFVLFVKQIFVGKGEK